MDKIKKSGCFNILCSWRVSMSGLKFSNDIKAEISTESLQYDNIKLPIGVQSFQVLREENYLYIDKTSIIYELISTGRQYFLSRPRRFGKSLFLSTLEAFWSGKKELFHGLAIERLVDQLVTKYDFEWTEWPIFYFDFNKEDYNREHALEDVLDEQLRKWEMQYNCGSDSRILAERFRNIIEFAYKATGKKAVVLVDEYDKPLLDVLGNKERQEHNKQVFKGFFSTLKSYDNYLKFVFITGVTRFSKVSIFSDLNQLNDISMDERYSEICGITEAELDEYFSSRINSFSEKQQISPADCKEKLKKMYDGYHFHALSKDIYNPYSIMNSFYTYEFSEYWFSTGTPTFLVEKLKNSNYDITQFTSKDFYVNTRELADYTESNQNPIPLLYQTGYLTLKEYDRKYDMCRLSYPNDEVKYAFLETLLPQYFDAKEPMSPLDIRGFDKDIESGNLESFINRFKMLFARIPYPTDRRLAEWNYQAVVYIVFTLLGKYTMAEVHTSVGRIDCAVETKEIIYIFEFKLDKDEESALKQIEDKCYLDYYAADPREKVSIGININSETRNIDGWSKC